MIRRELVISLLCVVGLSFGCKKGGDGSGASEDEGTSVLDDANIDAATGEVTADVPGTPADFLVGKWQSDCIDQPGFLQASVFLQYDFSVDGNASSKTLSYAGAGCTKRFTKADVDNLIVQINNDRALVGTAPLSAAELVPYNELWFPTPAAFTFKLGKKLKDSSVEMNATQRTGGEVLNTYLTIFVEAEADLYFAEICLKADLDAGVCSAIKGDSVKNRARDMTNSIPFHKM